ncbi:hypothetical protein [Zunongwangia atlantica]|uniref:Uncharacterized protein n=1 Tax=Zunongwangia atlantica 22II14-10F7 TaxID=1185767 RepID=A0A1Y1T2X3_9FLAO|nr:hypothetical protein [Zunongwangia atlantica]ORL45378.1 hypothetical protein IIF7_11168 [Zunongwangia atlantica 22II14-10F7]
MENLSRDEKIEYLQRQLNKYEGTRDLAISKLYEQEKLRVTKNFNFLRWLLLSIFAFLSFLISKIDFTTMDDYQQIWNLITLGIACFLFIWIAVYLSVEGSRISKIDVSYISTLLDTDQTKIKWNEEKYKNDFKNDTTFIGITLFLFIFLVVSIFITTILPFLKIKGYIC